MSSPRTGILSLIRFELGQNWPMWLLCQPKSFWSWLWDFGTSDSGLTILARFDLICGPKITGCKWIQTEMTFPHIVLVIFIKKLVYRECEIGKNCRPFWAVLRPKYGWILSWVIEPLSNVHLRKVMDACTDKIPSSMAPLRAKNIAVMVYFVIQFTCICAEFVNLNSSPEHLGIEVKQRHFLTWLDY